MTTALISIDCCIVKHDGRIVIPIRPDHVGALKNPVHDLTTAPFVYVTDDPQLILASSSHNCRNCNSRGSDGGWNRRCNLRLQTRMPTRNSTSRRK